MSAPTAEQKLAIETKGTNIIVSAGAGSGKTFVLKERVLREIKADTTIDKMIILTFTNNAAAEMKERIRKIIINNKEVNNQLELLDSAYITTFDSFAQSIVKKYNYILNISKNFTIIDNGILNIEINRIMNEIFDTYYQNKNQQFVNLINDFCYKDDKELINNIINIYKKVVNIIDYNNYLDTYIDSYYSDAFIKDRINEYEEYILNMKDELIPLYDNLLDETINEKDIINNHNHIEMVLNSNSIDDLQQAFLTKLSDNRGGKVYTEEGKIIKDQIKNIEDAIKENIIYSKDELAKQYLSTKNNIEIIIDIIKKLDSEIKKFKEKNNAYEFNDIALKSIELVKEHPEVREEIKNNTYEIMIDEYQDTNDIQETFISYIQNNNVYMVGDVKQSIYRFRNANPYIFKSKYDKYSHGQDGFKIDLTLNFRSRSEVINNINKIFNLIMSDEIGGADYQEHHQMHYGNTTYDTIKDNNYKYDMQILNYELPDNKEYSKEEIEAFTIASDIKNKINNLANHDGKLEQANYSDFCILIDKSKNFELLKKVLESEGIPTTIDKDISIKEDDEIYILKNLVTIIIGIQNNNYDTNFKHAFISILRSYIYSMPDNEIYHIFKENNFKNTDLYERILKIIPYINSSSNQEIIIKLIDEFDIYNKLTRVGNIKERLTKIEYFVNNASQLNNYGMDINKLNNYFDELLNSQDDIKMSINMDNSNSVKIMTIHGSKGLEFNYVYMPYLDSNFINGHSSRYVVSNKYGIIIPYNDNGISNTFMMNLYNNYELKENISERIRLFYVGVTRTKEQIILINSFKDNNRDIITKNDLLKVKSYTDILSLIKNKLLNYTKMIDIEKIGLNHDYSNIKSTNYKKIIKSNSKIEVKDVNIDYHQVENKNFSKPIVNIIDKKTNEMLKLGTYVHYIFEIYDFKNANINQIESKYQQYIKNFLSHKEFSNISSAKIYKEHEILFAKDNNKYHGIIDLLIEYDDHFDIIDYKLSKIDSKEYQKQLKGYQDYIENKYHKKTNIYLYSIVKDELKLLN